MSRIKPNELRQAQRFTLPPDTFEIVTPREAEEELARERMTTAELEAEEDSERRQRERAQRMSSREHQTLLKATGYTRGQRLRALIGLTPLRPEEKVVRGHVRCAGRGNVANSAPRA